MIHPAENENAITPATSVRNLLSHQSPRRTFVYIDHASSTMLVARNGILWTTNVLRRAEPTPAKDNIAGSTYSEVFVMSR